MIGVDLLLLDFLYLHLEVLYFLLIKEAENLFKNILIKN